MNEKDTEKLIQAKGATAPRITPADVDANIVDVEIVKYVSKSGKVLRWAVITTQNECAVVGRPSVAVSSENDDQEIGEKVAIANSRNELWPLMGYELHSKINLPT
ncbi:Gp49 family protein [Herbaspirillum huttiense]|uniref:Gp49 family protein n=1 Tax=Herbaspirillum huttiense TaxID=863372 RepID=UPI0039AF9C12